mgnify:CR=1 FL=1
MKLSNRMIDLSAEFFGWMIYTYIPITAIKSEEIAMNARDVQTIEDAKKIVEDILYSLKN